MTEDNYIKARDEAAKEYAGLSDDDRPASFNRTCFAEFEAYKAGYNFARREILESEEMKALINDLDHFKAVTNFNKRFGARE